MPNIFAPTRRYYWACQMASDVDSETAKPPSRPRRKRKDGKKFSPPSSPQIEVEKDSSEVAASISKELEPGPEPKEEEEEEESTPTTAKQNVVVMQVRDIRDVVSGVPESPIDAEDDGDDDDDELAEDEEWEYYDIDEDGNEIIISDVQMEGRPQDDSMEQLLADARQFRSSTSNIDGQMSNTREESSIKEKVFNIISTIITIDFFVVVGLLLWFLAGIFCSSVLGDDSVQIMFNMNFERVTQP